jgi:hypothetical protein
MKFRKHITNDPQGCEEVLHTLNTIIDGLYALDVGTLTADPFNRTSVVAEALEKLGFTGSYFGDLTDKITLFRSIVCGDVLEWDELPSPPQGG